MPRRKKKFETYKQGRYDPVHPEKYAGRGRPRYLSSWELRFFRWCDMNPNVLLWGSENVVIPYVSPVDGRVHKYMVDNFIKIREGENIKKYLIEIKPKKQTQPPTKHGNKKQSTILYETATWAINQAKWQAAKQWCKKHNVIFQILTEEHLFFKGK